MPTLGEKMEGFRQSGKSDRFREYIHSKLGVDPLTLNQDMPWDEFKSRAQTFSKANKMLAPMDDLQQTITQDNYSDYLTRMEKIGNALAGAPPKTRKAGKTESKALKWAKENLGIDMAPPSAQTAEEITDWSKKNLNFDSSALSPPNPAQVVRLAGGALKGAIEGGGEVINELAHGGGYRTAATMAQLLMQPGKKPVDPGTGPYVGPSSADEYRAEVVDPRMKMAGVERTLAGVKDEMTGVAMLGRLASGHGTPEEAYAVGEGLGRGVTRGTAGLVLETMRDPVRTLSATPLENATMLGGPLMRGLGAGTRAAALLGKGGKLAKGARFAADVIDPQPAMRRMVTHDFEIQDMNPGQEIEYRKIKIREDHGELPAGSAKQFLDDNGIAYTPVRVAQEGFESTGSKIGRGARRAAAGALLLGEPLGGTAGAMVTGAALAGGLPPAVGAAARRLGSYKTNWTRQSFVDPSSMPDAHAEEAIRRTTVDPVKTGMGLEAEGHEASGIIAREGQAGVGPQAGVDAPEWFERTEIADPGTGDLVYPPGTVGQRLALDASRQRELAEAAGGKVISEGLRQKAREASEALAADMAEGKKVSPSYFYRLGNKHVRGMERLREVESQATDLRSKLEEAKSVDPRALAVMTTRKDAALARAEFVDAKVKASVLDQIKAESRHGTTEELVKTGALEVEAEKRMRALETVEPSAAELIKKEAEVERLKRILMSTELAEKTGRGAEDKSLSTNLARKGVSSADPLIQIKEASPEHQARIISMIEKSGGARVVAKGSDAGLTPKQIADKALQVQVVTPKRLKQIIKRTKTFGEGVREDVASGIVAKASMLTGTRARDLIKHVLVADEIELKALKTRVKNYGLYLEARDAYLKSKKSFESVKRNYSATVTRASKAANRLFDAQQRKKAVAAKSKTVAASVESEVGKEGLSKTRQRASKMRSAEVFVQQLEADVKKSRAAADHRMMEMHDAGASPILTMLEDAHAERKRSDAAAKTAKQFPQTERGIERIAGQEIPMGSAGRKTPAVDSQGNPVIKKDAFGREYTPVTRQAVATNNPVARKIIDATSSLVESVNPGSKLANPVYLNHLIASVWEKKAFGLAFSKRSRGYIAKAYAKQVMENFPGSDWRKADATAWFEKTFDGKIPKGGWKRKKFENEVRQQIEALISKEVAERAMGGDLVDFRITIPGVNGKPPVVLSAAEMGAKFLDPDRKNPLSKADREAVAQEAIAGVFESVRKHVEMDATNSSLAKTAMRGMSPDGILGDTNALNVVAKMVDGEAPPEILMFNPEKVAKSAMSGEQGNMQAALMQHIGDKHPTANFLEQINKLKESYVLVDPTKDGEMLRGLNQGLGVHGVDVPSGGEVFARAGYKDAVSSHMKFNAAMRDATTWLGRMVQESRVVQLTGTTATQFANLASNTVAIFAALGESPNKTMRGIFKTYETLWTKYEKGLLTGFEAAKWRAVMSTGIADSSMVSARLVDMFKGDTSQGLAGKYKQYSEFRKEIYKQGDSGPKLYLTLREFDRTYQNLFDMEAGTEAHLNMGKGRYLTVKKELDGEVTIGKRKIALDSDVAMKAIAESSTQFAKNILFDFNDMPLFVKRMVGKKGVLTSIFNVYFPWAFKASELPGKKGLMSNIAAYDPMGGMQTNSPMLNRRRAKEFAKLAMRRAMIQEGLRGVAHQYEDQGLGEMMNYDAQENMLITNPYTKDVAFIEQMNMGSASPAVMADAALRLMSTGAIYAGQGASKVLRGMGFKTVASMFGKTPQQYADVLRDKKGVYSEQEHQAARLYALHASGRLSNLKQLGNYFGITGGMFNNFIKDMEKGKFRTGTTIQFLRMMVGGDATVMLEAAAAAGAPEKDWSSRHMMGGDDVEPRMEAFGKWWFARAFRFGFREKQLYGKKGGLQRFISNRKNMLKDTFLKPAEDEAARLDTIAYQARKGGTGVAAVAEAEEAAKAAHRRAGNIKKWVTISGDQFTAAAFAAAKKFHEKRRARLSAATGAPRLEDAANVARSKSLLASPEVQGAFSR